MTWLAGMEGIPTDYRHMEGYGVNTFTLINAEGKVTYVKFHWRPEEGKHAPQRGHWPTDTCHMCLGRLWLLPGQSLLQCNAMQESHQAA